MCNCRARGAVPAGAKCPPRAEGVACYKSHITQAKMPTRTQTANCTLGGVPFFNCTKRGDYREFPPPYCAIGDRGVMLTIPGPDGKNKVIVSNKQ